VHFAIDHLELTDFEVVPAPPFEDEREAVTLLEFVKFMLSTGSFVIAGKEETHFMDSLESLTDDGVDLRVGLETVSVVDSDDDHSDRYAFTLQFTNEPLPLPLRLVDCGGCPGYLSLWDAIIDQAARVKEEEKKDSESRIARELRLALLAKIRGLVRLLFSRLDDDRVLGPLPGPVVSFGIQDTEAQIAENAQFQ
jgi:hypothetical protein